MEPSVWCWDGFFAPRELNVSSKEKQCTKPCSEGRTDANVFPIAHHPLPQVARWGWTLHSSLWWTVLLPMLCDAWLQVDCMSLLQDITKWVWLSTAEETSVFLNRDKYIVHKTFVQRYSKGLSITWKKMIHSAAILVYKSTYNDEGIYLIWKVLVVQVCFLWTCVSPDHVPVSFHELMNILSLGAERNRRQFYHVPKNGKWGTVGLFFNHLGAVQLPAADASVNICKGGTFRELIYCTQQAEPIEIYSVSCTSVFISFLFLYCCGFFFLAWT